MSNCPTCDGKGKVGCLECSPAGSLTTPPTVFHDCLVCDGTGEVEGMGQKITNLILGSHHFPCAVCGQLLVWTGSAYVCPDCDNPKDDAQ